jgi:hypothetical protein
MTIIAGMDLGYGSQVKIVRTNYLVVKDSAQASVQQCANFLDLYNHVVTANARGTETLLTADYIVCGANAPSGVAAGKGANVLPLVATSGANVAFGGNHANPVAKSANTQLQCLAVLNMSAIEFTDATFTAGAIIVPVLAGPITDNLAGELLLDNLGAVADDTATTGLMPTTLNLDDMFDDMVAALGTGTVNLVGIADADFVRSGNAAGTTPTALSDYTIGANSVGLVSVVTLAK